MLSNTNPTNTEGELLRFSGRVKITGIIHESGMEDNDTR